MTTDPVYLIYGLNQHLAWPKSNFSCFKTKPSLVQSVFAGKNLQTEKNPTHKKLPLLSAAKIEKPGLLKTKISIEVFPFCFVLLFLKIDDFVTIKYAAA